MPVLAAGLLFAVSSWSGAALSTEGQTQHADQARAGQSTAAEAAEFSAAVPEDLVGRLADALVRRNQRRFFSAFDGGRVADWARFRDRADVWLSRHDFRVYYRILETRTEGGRGVALVEFQLEQSLHDSAAPPVRRREQVRFEFERGAAGWKIVALSPREFFS